MVWRHQLRRPDDAPRDGSHFMAIKKGRLEPERFVWDAEMGCFLSDEFTVADRLACWWPLDTPRPRIPPLAQEQEQREHPPERRTS